MNGTDRLQSGALPRSRYLIFISIAVIGCALDLLTKYWVFEWRGIGGPDNTWWLIEPFVGIQTTVNTGALFGYGSGWGRFFALLSIAAAIAIPVWLFGYRAARSSWLTVALACVMAGILGNLYDRLGLWVEPGMPAEWSSGVRDWILFRWRHERFTWPNFNIADSLLVCGSLMLLWQAMWEKSEEKPAKSTAAIN